ncbi:hypothetical protein Taro_030460 [Colocasia esculenta]|uniref:Uncharacterized protein n=1 Tax=Colocasia esculenta TaxID=4460 RepID=A0A843W0A5_COLES|nr:hypothetical protein [Colocasia esculenta]
MGQHSHIRAGNPTRRRGKTMCEAPHADHSVDVVLCASALKIWLPSSLPARAFGATLPPKDLKEIADNFWLLPQSSARSFRSCEESKRRRSTTITPWALAKHGRFSRDAWSEIANYTIDRCSYDTEPRFSLMLAGSPSRFAVPPRSAVPHSPCLCLKFYFN